MRDLPAWWASPHWRAEVMAWAEAELAAAAYEIVGEVEQPRIRFWSTALVIPTDRGRVWLKENNPAQGFEAALVAALRRIVPERIIDTIAIEPRRGWLLTPDHGPTLRELGGATPKQWIRVLSEFGSLQRELESHGPALAAAGLPAAPATTTPSYAAARLDDLAALPADDPAHICAQQRAEAAANAHLLSEACAQLEASGLRESLQHNDLHANNAFATAPGTPLRFFDLGDAVWAHPFASLLIPRGALARDLEAPVTDPRVRRVVDAYLENWSDVAPLARLRDLVEPAARVAAVHRAMSWGRLLAEVPASAVPEPEWRDAESWWLLSAFDAG